MRVRTFHQVWQGMVLLLCLWQIGCTPAPPQSGSDAVPAALTHVLKQEGSAAAPEYSIATTPSDLQSAWVIRQGARLPTVPQRELGPTRLHRRRALQSC